MTSRLTPIPINRLRPCSSISLHAPWPSISTWEFLEQSRIRTHGLLWNGKGVALVPLTVACDRVIHNDLQYNQVRTTEGLKYLPRNNGQAKKKVLAGYRRLRYIWGPQRVRGVYHPLHPVSLKLSRGRSSSTLSTALSTSIALQSGSGHPPSARS